MTRNWFGRGYCAHTQLPRRGQLRVECLEDRAVPATFYVNTTLDDVTPGNGQQSLRESITRANTTPGADTIVVPAGVFKTSLAGASENLNVSGDFDITDSLTIQGAGMSLTIIDGQQLDRVFDVIGTGPSSIRGVFQGLTVRNGADAADGGGIRVGFADLVVRDCVVSGNGAAGDGGGISNGSLPGTGNVTIVRTIAGRNVAGDAGGGLSVTGASSLLTVRDSTVRRNLASDNGGGINAVTATVTNSTVSGNTAATNTGGGIYTDTATVTNSTVSGNSASAGGGIIVGILTNCTVSGNSAVSFRGGGIYVSVTANLTNCTVSGNTAATDGGGIYAAATTLVNCTIAENIAHNGGGLFHDPLAVTPFTLHNTLVALNLVDFGGSGPDVANAFTSLGHNLIGRGGAGFTNGVNGDRVGTSANPLDPKLGPLQNNGGRTKTHVLLAGSPAIDHGDNNGAPPTDQRGFGFARKKDGNGDGIVTVDIGSFEK